VLGQRCKFLRIVCKGWVCFGTAVWPGQPGIACFRSRGCFGRLVNGGAVETPCDSPYRRRRVTARRNRGRFGIGRSKAKGWITLVEPSNFVPQKKKAGWPQIGLWVERLGPTLRKDRENAHAALFRATRLIFIRRLKASLESLMKNERFPGEAFVGWHTATRRPGLVLVEVLAHSIERYTVS
jgi:hypothetical protein